MQCVWSDVPPGAIGQLLDGLVQIIRVASHHDVGDLHNEQQKATDAPRNGVRTACPSNVTTPAMQNQHSRTTTAEVQLLQQLNR
jgi:hypothetical protein